MHKKKKFPIFPIVGIVSPQGLNNPTGETVLTKEMQEALAEVMKPVSVPDVLIPKEHTVQFTIPKPDKMPKVSIDQLLLEKLPPHVGNHPVMEFLEDIIYCPSQIEFYFRADGQVMSLYIRQRHGETTAQLVPCYPNGEYQYDSLWPEVELSRDYDIEGKHYESAEAEEQEIIAIEKDCLSRLRVMFPDVPFPEHPNRRRGRGYKRLPDVTL